MTLYCVYPRISDLRNTFGVRLASSSQLEVILRKAEKRCSRPTVQNGFECHNWRLIGKFKEGIYTNNIWKQLCKTFTESFLYALHFFLKENQFVIVLKSLSHRLMQSNHLHSLLIPFLFYLHLQDKGNQHITAGWWQATSLLTGFSNTVAIDWWMPAI